MRYKKYEVLLGAVFAARATSFVFNKMVLENMDVFNLLAVRFIGAFALLLIIFHRRIMHMKKRELLSGAAVGVAFFLVMTSELAALKFADSSTVSLLENCAIVLVPLFEAMLIKKLPDKATVGGSVIALLGVLCLGTQIGGLSIGIVLSLVSSVLYAAAIILTAQLSHGASDALCIGIVQVGTMGALALIASALFETPRMPASSGEWIMIIILTVVCTGFGFTLQPLAQSRVSASRAGVFCAVSPAIAALLGAMVLHERFTLLGVIGLILILLSIELPYIKNSRRKSS